MKKLTHLLTATLFLTIAPLHPANATESPVAIETIEFSVNGIQIDLSLLTFVSEIEDQKLNIVFVYPGADDLPFTMVGPMHNILALAVGDDIVAQAIHRLSFISPAELEAGIETSPISELPNLILSVHAAQSSE